MILEYRTSGSPTLPEVLDVSVVIAVYNGLPYLSEQLAALARQTYSGRWEVIVSDNGSKDSSVDVARGFAGRLPLRIVDSRDVEGWGGALTAAIRVARGRLLLFCDQDDIVADDWVEIMAAALEKYPAVGGHLDEASLNPESVREWRPPATPGSLPRPFGLLPAPVGANCGLRREVYDEIGGLDLSFRTPAAEETDLFWRVQLAGHQLAYVPEAVVAYRHRPDLRSLLRQWRRYGRGRAYLVARYQALGLYSPESWRDGVATAVWLLLHGVNCLRGRTRRARYLRVLAHVLGQVEGSRDVGVIHVRRSDQHRAAYSKLPDAVKWGALEFRQPR
ncbi:MAG TPA: glycosyltransferase [Streptosporangiaceae bacterium]|nr:glycosyltransferase [Streptosporangiaceae bacterium]